jgi:hypothetical protein
LKPSALTTEGEVLPLHQPPADRSRIATVVYGGFSRCSCTFQMFQSDTERTLAQILERDSLRWLRPVAGHIYYRRGVEQPEFVATATEANLLIETKKAGDVRDGRGHREGQGGGGVVRECHHLFRAAWRQALAVLADPAQCCGREQDAGSLDGKL